MSAKQQPADWVAALQTDCPSYFGQSQLFLYRGNDAVARGRDQVTSTTITLLT